MMLSLKGKQQVIQKKGIGNVFIYIAIGELSGQS
jgi:hypothetical protein